jgi:hypothetical protein
MPRIYANARGLGYAAATVIVLGLYPTTAGAQTYPWCAEYSGRDFGGTNCGFSTEQQCELTISGIGGYCHENLWYRKPAVAPPVHPRRKHRRHNRNG